MIAFEKGKWGQYYCREEVPLEVVILLSNQITIRRN